MSMTTWSRDTVLNFIEMYKFHECLWKMKSKDYRNNLMRERAYEELVLFCKPFHPEANKEFVIKKISNLRTTFKRELKKHENSKQSGMGSDEVYEPSLWYFHNLMFLEDQDMPSAGSSNLQSYEYPSSFSIEATDMEESLSPKAGSEMSLLDVKEEPPSAETLTSLSQSQHSQLPTVYKQLMPEVSEALLHKKKRKTNDDELIKAACLRLLNPANDDEHDNFGKNVAHKLRRLTTEQQIYAEKLISDVLFEAQLGSLTRSSSVVTTSS
ncbi:uncharacterized protein LOC101861586 [Aplysia californica]|uniref:Uncharacterized protein LOC101861586 n=1 Tax=Aplysia californica TaxID=6500 RepID=A0ABM1A124_APLCA|nr:uncharacterized protein LOC101861586 [Aplysia californica]